MNKTNFIFAILVAIVGLAALIFPSSFMGVIIVLLGAASVIDGIFDLVKIFRLTHEKRVRYVALVHAIISIILGLIAVICPLTCAAAINSLINVFAVILGIYLILSAISKIYLAVVLVSLEIKPKVLITEIIISFVLAIILFLLPQNFGNWVVRIAGIIIFLCGASFAFYTFREKPIVVEAENVRDDGESENKKD